MQDPPTPWPTPVDDIQMHSALRGGHIIYYLAYRNGPRASEDFPDRATSEYVLESLRTALEIEKE